MHQVHNQLKMSENIECSPTCCSNTALILSFKNSRCVHLKFSWGGNCTVLHCPQGCWFPEGHFLGSDWDPGDVPLNVGPVTFGIAPNDHVKVKAVLWGFDTTTMSQHIATVARQNRHITASTSTRWVDIMILVTILTITIINLAFHPLQVEIS